MSLRKMASPLWTCSGAKNHYPYVCGRRIVRDFMVQAGDPTGTGKGGESIWGGKFEDEINPDLKVAITCMRSVYIVHVMFVVMCSSTSGSHQGQ